MLRADLKQKRLDGVELSTFRLFVEVRGQIYGAAQQRGDGKVAEQHCVGRIDQYRIDAGCEESGRER